MNLTEDTRAQFICVPGVETLSGPGNVTYRRWHAGERVSCLFAYRQYSDDAVVAQIGLLHGITLERPQDNLIGLLITPDNSDKPWSTRFPEPNGEASKLFVLDRLMAIDSSVISCGDTETIRPILLRQRALKAISSRSKSLNDTRLTTSWTRWVKFIGSSNHQASTVLMGISGEIESAQSGQGEGVSVQTQLQRLSCLLASHQ